MNAHLISTALLAIGLDNPVLADAVEPTIFDSLAVTVSAIEASSQIAISNSFANGDFTSISQSIKTDLLYTGDRSAAMASIRMLRF